MNQNIYGCYCYISVYVRLWLICWQHIQTKFFLRGGAPEIIVCCCVVLSYSFYRFFMNNIFDMEIGDILFYSMMNNFTRL